MRMGIGIWIVPAADSIGKFIKRPLSFSLLSLTENLKAQSFGRELVFSADLWYNGANEKPLPLGEVAAKPTERAKWSENN